jgi:hypothetical protein
MPLPLNPWVKKKVRLFVHTSVLEFCNLVEAVAGGGK